MALALNDHEALLAMGSIPGQTYSKKSYIFNTNDHSFHFISDVDSGHDAGLIGFDCQKLSEQRAVCGGGGNEWLGDTAR